MKTMTNLIAAIAMPLIICSCGSGDRSAQMTVADVELNKIQNEKAPSAIQELNKPVAGIASLDSAGNVSQSNDSILNSGGPTNIDWDKKIIKNAHVTLELKDYNTYNASLHNKLKGYGAYIAQEQQTESDDQIANNITIKVPVDKFDDLNEFVARRRHKSIGENYFNTGCNRRSS